MKERQRLAILVSGEGSTMEHVLRLADNDQLRMDVGLVVSSREGAPATEKAKRRLSSENVLTISPRHFKNGEGKYNSHDFEGKILDEIHNRDITMVALLGWLPILSHLPSTFNGPIINEHPGPLDPGRKLYQGESLDFGGKGMYGRTPTVARIAYSWATGEDYWTEATVHYVTKSVDQDLLVRTKRFDYSWAIPSVRGWRKPISLDKIYGEYRNILINAAREVHDGMRSEEHQNVANALQMFEERRPEGFRRSSPLIPNGREVVLFESKQLARKILT